MGETADDFESTEAASIRRTVCDLGEALRRPHKTVVEYTAIGAFLQSIYGGIERLLKHRLKQLGHIVPSSDHWHLDLLAAAEEHGLLPAEFGPELRGFLGFRHLAMHGYGFMLDPHRLLPLAQRGALAATGVLRALGLEETEPAGDDIPVANGMAAE